MREDELNLFGSSNELFYMAKVCYLAAYRRDLRAEKSGVAILIKRSESLEEISI